ncbi:MAG: cell division/cell wall cluster transcriptional repressor MraZ [Pseudomonadota bacterium]
MNRRFRGESVHKVDGKGRVSIPASFRRVLEEGDPDWAPGQQPTVVLVYGIPGASCVEGYSVQGITALDDRVSRMPMFSKSRKALERMLNTRSVYAQVEDNGRIVLSPRLREIIAPGEAVFAGMGDRFQIWDPEAYAADNDGLDDWVDEQGDEGNPLLALDKEWSPT